MTPPPPTIGVREYQAADLAFFQSLSEQASIRRLTGMPADGDAAAWARYIAERHDGPNRILLITAADRAVGALYVMNLGAPELYQIGYCVDEAERGRGVATRAVSAAAASLFGATRCVRLQATVEPANLPSQRVLEKCGFEREGLMRRGVKIGAALVDAYLYSRLRSDAPTPAYAPRSR